VTGEPDLGAYRGWLQKVAGNMIGFGDPRLDDLIQEGYIAMWKALSTFSSSRGSQDWWLKYKAHGRMLEVVRRTVHRNEDELSEAPEEALAAPDLLEALELAYHEGEIAEAISRLTPKQRRYVVARFWLGLSGNEMKQLGVFAYDPSALWNSRKNGARWKLQESLQHLATR